MPFSSKAAAFVSAIEAQIANLGMTEKFLDTLEDVAQIVRRADQAVRLPLFACF